MLALLLVCYVTLGIIHWKGKVGASLVVQWVRIRLPVQGTRAGSLVWEDATCRGAAQLVRSSCLA